MANRLDKTLVSLGHCESRNKAQQCITAGYVEVNGVVITNASFIVKNDDVVVLKQHLNYVSRGGEKLAEALKHLKLSPKKLTCLDIGASTGGFTDCLLQHGAEQVFSVDVGTNQLHPSLKSNPKVHCFENTHVDQLNLLPLPSVIDWAVIDVSFISLSQVLPVVCNTLEQHQGQLILALLKPQFEHALFKTKSKTITANQAKQSPEKLKQALQATCPHWEIIEAFPLTTELSQTFCEYMILLKPIR